MKHFDSNGPASELARTSALALGNRIKAREVSCLEAVNGYLERIAAYNDGLGAFITVAADEARAEAKRLDQLLAKGVYLGPLHGIPIAVKDNLDTAGIPTTGGSRALAKNLPAKDAEAVARLKAAGAVILGKTNMHELAFGITGNNPHYGAARNPYDHTRIAGGSSGGSAIAAAAGLAAAAIGTDTGGSIRIPAALCGCVGLKPTWGRVGRGGLMYLSSTLDCIGPITRNAEDAALILAAIAGSAGNDERDSDASTLPVPDYTPQETNWQGVRLGVPRSHFYQDNDPSVAQVLDAALGKMDAAGAELIDVAIDDIPGSVPHGFAIVFAETIHLLGEYLCQLDPPLQIADILGQLGPDVAGVLGSQVGEDAAPMPAHAYLDAVRVFRPAFQAKLNAALQDIDALVVPATPIPAAPIGEDAETMVNGRMEQTFATFIRHTFFANIAGLPAVTVPAGKNAAGLPVGMQFVGKHWQESGLLKLARAWLKEI